VSRMDIAFFGLGNMGWPMARRLHEAGHALRCYDPSADAVARATAAGLQILTTIGEAASCDVVLLMLPNSDVVETVLLGEGLLAGMSSGSTVVDMSSSRPASTRMLAGKATEADVRYIDAPVSGGVVGAESGNLTIMVGGAAEHVAGLRPVLDVLGTKVMHVGPPGAGHALKALNNLMSATHLLISSEALLVGREFGLDVEVMLDAINTSSGRSGSTEVKWPKYVVTGRYDSGFGAALMLKDMGIALDLAGEMGVATPLSADAVALWREAVAALPPGADHTAIVQWLENKKAAEVGAPPHADPPSPAHGE
jgi:3-hydroxyisobutyrate dehydrogenase